VLSTRQEPPTGQAAARPLSALAIVSQGACPRRQEHLRRSRLQRMRYPRHEPQGLARPVGKLHEVTRHDALGHTRHAGIRVQVLAFIRRQQKQRIGKARIKFFRHVFHLRLSAPQIAQSLSDCASSLNCSCLILNRADSSKPPFASLTLKFMLARASVLYCPNVASYVERGERHRAKRESQCQWRLLLPKRRRSPRSAWGTPLCWKQLFFFAHPATFFRGHAAFSPLHLFRQGSPVLRRLFEVGL
jgi:hypothetical protein